MISARNIWIVFKKEFLSFFNSPVAYIVVTVFLLITGWFFFQQFFLMGQATMRPLFSMIPIIFIFLAPAITMRLIAEERKTKTFSLLLTLPVRDSEIILGKYLAALGLLALALLLTLPYALSISSIGSLEWGPVLGGYLGGILMGAAYLAIGMLSTSLTKNQIVAFILGLALCFFFFAIDKMLLFLPDSAATVFEYLSVDYHFHNIARGVIDLRDIVFYFTFIGALIMYSVYAIQREDWR